MAFEDLAKSNEVMEFSKEFMEDFSRFMEESVRESKINEARAIESAKNTYIVC